MTPNTNPAGARGETSMTTDNEKVSKTISGEENQNSINASSEFERQEH